MTKYDPELSFCCCFKVVFCIYTYLRVQYSLLFYMGTSSDPCIIGIYNIMIFSKI